MENNLIKNLKRVAVFVFAIVLSVTMLMPFAVVQTLASSTQFSFNTIDGKTVYSYSSDYDVTINVFGKKTCYNTQTMLQNIIFYGYDKSSRIKVNFIDCASDTKDSVSEFSKAYSGSGVDFCYDTGYAANNAAWYYADLAGESENVELPVVAFVNGDGSVRRITTGLINDNYLINIIENGTFFDEMVRFSITGTDNYDYAYAVLESLNRTRSSLGLSTLTMDNKLLDVAMQRAAEISVYFSHTRPDNQPCFSLTPGYSMLGENIAIGQNSPESVMTSWTNSSGHYANMIDGDFRSVGIGCFRSSSGTYCWVQYFSGGVGEAVTKSGSIKTTHNISAVFSNLMFEFSSPSITRPLAKNGDIINLSIINRNIGFSYTTQNIDASSFNYNSSDSDIVSVAGNGEFTVVGKGKVNLTMSLKSNSNVKYTCVAEVGHDHKGGKWIVDKEATVNAPGKKHQECTVCGEVLKMSKIAQLKPGKPKLSKVEITVSGVKITWGKVSGADDYIVYRRTYDAKLKKWSGWSKLKSGVTSTSYLDKTAKSGTYYIYTVKANNEAGCGGYTSGLKTYFVATPKVTSTANTNNAITVKWSKVAGASGYYVYRKTTGGWTRVCKTTGTSFTDKNAKAGITYRYTVKAYYGSYVSSYNSKGTAVRRLTTPKLTKITSAKSGITISWGKVTGATGYIVYRKTGSGSWQKLTTINGNTKVSYLDKTAKKGVTYTYTVKAYYGSSTSYHNAKGLTIKDKY